MRRLLSMLLVHLLLLPGVLADNLWQENAYVAFVEPYGYARLNSQPGSMATIDGVTYKLPKAVTGEERESIVELTQRILAQIGQAVPVDRALTITLVDAEYPARVDGDSLWVARSAVGTADYPTALVKLVCGNDFPAALLRGWGSLIHESLGYPVDAMTVEDALNGLDPMYLDLNEACFLPEYANEATIARLTALSRALAQDALDSGMMAGCDQDGFLRLRSALLAEHGITHDGGTMDDITFHSGGQVVRLNWESEWASCTLFDDYADLWGEIGFHKDPFNEGYADLKEQISNLEAQMAWAREVLSSYTEPQKVSVLLEQTSDLYRHGGVLQYSGYVDGAHTMHVGSLLAFLHEYIHAQTTSLSPYMEAPWRNEAIAYYLAVQPETPELNYSSMLDQWNFERLLQEEPDYIAECIAHLGHQPNVFDKADQSFLCNVQCMENQTFGVMQNQPAAIRGFVHWLALSHARENILDALIGDTPEDSLGASWEVLTKQWREMVWEEFAWVEEASEE